MRRLGVSPGQLFEAVELGAMQDLPKHDYEYAEWRLARVGIDYHVEIAGFYYSVPHALIRVQIDTRATERVSALCRMEPRAVCAPRGTSPKVSSPSSRCFDMGSLLI